MTDFNTLADAFADMVWERLKERVEEVARDIFISGVETHGLTSKDEVEGVVKDAITEHVDEVTHIDDERIGEACAEAVAEIFRDLARSL